MKSGLWVLDAMTVHPVTANPHLCIRDVAALMERHDVGTVVVKQGHELLGVVAEADIVKRGVLEGYDTRRTPVERIMTRDIVTVPPHMDLFDVVTLMRETNVHTLPVIDDENLIGFVTAKDILKLQPDLFETFASTFELREEKQKISRLRSRQAVLDED